MLPNLRRLLPAAPALVFILMIASLPAKAGEAATPATPAQPAKPAKQQKKGRQTADKAKEAQTESAADKAATAGKTGEAGKTNTSAKAGEAGKAEDATPKKPGPKRPAKKEPGVIHPINDANFKENIKSGVHLVYMWASWCGPCKYQKPVVQELATMYKDRITVHSLDVDAEDYVPAVYEVNEVPTCILFKDGKGIIKFVGVAPAKEFIEEIDPLLQPGQ